MKKNIDDIINLSNDINNLTSEFYVNFITKEISRLNDINKKSEILIKKLKDTVY